MGSKRDHQLYWIIDALGIEEEQIVNATAAQTKKIIADRLEQERHKRTDGELIRDVVTIRLAGKQYDIKALPYAKDAELRRALFALVEKYADKLLAGVNVDQLQEMSNEEAGLAVIQGVKRSFALLAFEATEDIVDLFFAYAPDLPREEIINRCSSAELIKAAGEVFKVFLLPLLVTTIEMVTAGMSNR